MKSLLLICVIIAVVSARPLADGLGEFWKDCSSSTDIGKINNIMFNPDPPKKGESLNVVANFTLTEQVTSGNVEIAVKWGFIPIKKTENLCDLIQQAGQTCPIAAGSHQITTSVDIPSDIPSGHYTGSVKADAEDSKEIVCVDLDIHL